MAVGARSGRLQRQLADMDRDEVVADLGGHSPELGQGVTGRDREGVRRNLFNCRAVRQVVADVPRLHVGEDSLIGHLGGLVARSDDLKVRDAR